MMREEEEVIVDNLDRQRETPEQENQRLTATLLASLEKLVASNVLICSRSNSAYIIEHNGAIATLEAEGNKPVCLTMVAPNGQNTRILDTKQLMPFLGTVLAQFSRNAQVIDDIAAKKAVMAAFGILNGNGHIR